MTYIDIKYKRAKDLTNTDVVRATFTDPESGRTYYSEWTEVLDVYTGYDSYDILKSAWLSSFPAVNIEALAERLLGSVEYTVIRVVIPATACESGDLTWAWLGFYGFELLSVQSESAFKREQQ